MMIIACKKNSVNADLITEKQHYTESQINFLADLKHSIVNSNTRDADPSNANNPYDYMGIYYTEMLETVQAQEAISPSLTREQFKSKFVSYQNDHPFNVFDSGLIDENFEIELMELIHQIGTQYGSLSTINQLKIIENAIVSSNLFDDGSKLALLSLSASSKYAHATSQIMINMMTGIIEEPVDPAGLNADCVEREYAQNLQSALGDWVDHPFSTLSNWFSVPTVVATSLADAVWACR